MTLNLAAQRNLGDSVAIALSATCLAHCLVLPVVLALLPAWAAWLELPEGFERWVLVAAVPVSIVVLARAWLDQHQGGGPTLAVGLIGLAVMACASTLEGNATEPIVTSAGALMLTTAHSLNWRRRVRCPG